jgi:hypothetical protein
MEADVTWLTTWFSAWRDDLNDAIADERQLYSEQKSNGKPLDEASKTVRFTATCYDLDCCTPGIQTLMRCSWGGNQVIIINSYEAINLFFVTCCCVVNPGEADGVLCWGACVQLTCSACVAYQMRGDSSVANWTGNKLEASFHQLVTMLRVPIFVICQAGRQSVRLIENWRWLWEPSQKQYQMSAWIYSFNRFLQSDLKVTLVLSRGYVID